MNYPDELKVPPHSIEAERAVLGSILIDPGCLVTVELESEDFYLADHRMIYRTMLSCDAKGSSPDLIVTCEALGDDLDDVGGVAYLSDLAANTATSANVGSYARAVKDRANLRRGIQSGHKIADAGFAGDMDAMTGAMSECLGEMAGDATRDTWDASSSLKVVMERIDRVGQGEAAGIPFGVPPLDYAYPGGMQPGQLIVIGARPGMGKSSVVLNMLSSGVAAAVASLEMSHEELTIRQLAMSAQIKYEKIDTANMTQPEWDRFAKVAGKFNEKNLHVMDRGGASIGDITRFSMQAKHRNGIQLLVVDYLQLMEASRHGDNRNEQIGYLSRQLKGLAKRLHIPVIAVSQLNRELEKRSNKRPVMSDLRESGQIEQDADMIIMLYRDGYYNDVPDDTIEFLVEKCKNGPVSRHTWGWDGELMLLRERQK